MSDLIVSKDLVQQLINSSESFPVDFDDAWKWLGYARKDLGLRRLKKYFSAGQDFSFLQSEEAQKQGERTVTARIDKYFLTVECFKELGMLAQTEQGKLVRKYYLECERIIKTVIPAQNDRIRELELEIQLRNAETNSAHAQKALLDTRNYIVTALPESAQQKILGYSEVVKVEYRDRVIQNEDLVRDGSTVNKTTLCKRLGFYTKGGKPDYKRLNQFLVACNLPESAWQLTAAIQENLELTTEAAREVERRWANSLDRSRYLGE